MNTRTIKIPKEQTRSAEIVTETIGERQVKRISISSTAPYLRFDWESGKEYYEVLSHDSKDIDDERLKLGLPILFNHHRDAHLGRATKYNNNGSRMDVGTTEDVIWSESEFAVEKKKDIDNGSIVGTSVGYSVTGMGKKIGEKDGMDILSFPWSPHEFSFCTIEADTSVGAGRQRSTKDAEGKEIEFSEITIDLGEEKPNNNPTRQNLSMETPTTPAPADAKQIEVTRNEATQSERARVKKINDFVAGIVNPDPTRDWKGAAAGQAIKSIEAGDDYDTFRAKALDSFAGVKAVEAASLNPEIGLSDKERRRYSIVELIRQHGKRSDGNVKIDDFYRECSQAVAKINRRDPEGIWIPDDITNRSLQETHGIGTRQMQSLGQQIGQMQRTLTVGSFPGGGALVGTDLLAGSLIELLLNKVAFLNGFVYLGGLVGNIAIPKVTGGQTSYWLPEGGTVTSSNMTFSQLGLVPHRLVASTAYDKQLIAQASLSVEALVRDTIARIMAVEKNRAMINGSGAGGEPLGLLNIAGVQSVTTTVNVPTWVQIVNFWTKLATANADMLGPISWLMAPAASGNLQSLPKIGSTFPIFIQENGMVNGYPVNTTNNVPSGLGILGVGSEFIVADWAGIDIVVNPYSLDLSGQIRTTVQMWTDNGMRHEVAFAVSSQSMAAA